MNALRRSFVVAVLGLIVASGEVLAANCGGVTACACGDSVVADRTLTAADTVTTVTCTGFGLVVAPGVNLNLGGRTITGNGAFVNNTDGVYLANNATLTGPGRVVAFFLGIDGVGSSGQSITSVQARNNRFGIFCMNSCVMSKNVASNNVVDGIVLNNGSGGSTMYSNTCANNGASGISIRLGLNNNIVQKNITTGNVHGISLASNGNAISYNESYSNSQNGILADGGASNNTLTSNKTESNKIDGIHVEGNNNTLTLNTARVSGDDGIEVIGSGNHLRDNHGTQNTNDGLLAIPQGGANVDDGKNTGDANGGIQCRIDGAVCKL